MSGFSRYMAEIAQFAPLSREEEYELSKRVQVGDLKARDELVKHGLRLVPWLAKRLWPKLRKFMPFEDLVQEGNIGLIRAAEKYEYQHDAKFSTYAFYWIRQAMYRAAADRGAPIRIPVHVQEDRRRLVVAKGKLTEELKRVPTAEETAEAVGLSVEAAADKLASFNIKVFSLSDPAVRDTFPSSYTYGRSHGPRVLTVEEVLPDTQTPTPEVVGTARAELEVAEDYVRGVVEALLSMNISQRNRDAFVLYYGLDGSREKRTLEEVGQSLGFTRERARQILNQVWRKIEKRGFEAHNDPFFQKIEAIRELGEMVDQ